MIVEKIRGEIEGMPLNHIAFAISTEGVNEIGFAGRVASQINPDLADTGPKELGEVISFESHGKTFHGIVCHSLAEPCWSQTPEVVEKALNELDVPDGEPIAVVLMGGGATGWLSGSDVNANLAAMERSNKQLHVYFLPNGGYAPLS